MVALPTPNSIRPPEPDGLPTEAVSSHTAEKLYYWSHICNTFATLTHNKWAGRRACVDLYASYGVNEDKTDGDLYWGSPLWSLLVQFPFDTYVFGDKNPHAIETLTERIRRLNVFGAEVFQLALGDETLGRQISAVKSSNPAGPKIVLLEGDANDAAFYVRQLLPAFEGRRICLSMIDPYSANFSWDALSALTYRERMDLLMLFPEEMDIKRNVQNPPERLTRFFGSSDWQGRVGVSRNNGRALREFYEDRLKTLLDYTHISAPKTIRNSRQVPIYKLLFASKHPLGLDVWHKVCGRDPHGQDALYLGPDSI
jgi:three-Cys-motif partner protein